MRQMVASRKPEGEMPTGRVPGRDDCMGIDGVALRERGDVVETRRNILKRRRPSSAGVPDTPVFDGPDGESVCLQRGAHMTAVGQVVLGSPPSAVKEDDDRERSMGGTARKPQNPRTAVLPAP